MSTQTSAARILRLGWYLRRVCNRTLFLGSCLVWWCAVAAGLYLGYAGYTPMRFAGWDLSVSLDRERLAPAWWQHAIALVTSGEFSDESTGIAWTAKTYERTFTRTQVVSVFQGNPKPPPGFSWNPPPRLRAFGLLPYYWSYATHYYEPEDGGLSRESVIHEAAFGWPMHMYGWRDTFGLAGLVPGGGPRYMYTSPRPREYFVIWPGVLLNALMAPVFALLVVVVTDRFFLSVVRRYRINANRCPDCGYSSEGSSESIVCPECGTRDDANSA